MTAPVETQAAGDAPMYEEYFGFVQQPFSLAPDPHFLYRGAAHQEALNLLRLAVRRREGFVVLTGDIGTGKTTSCRALLSELGDTVFTSLILDPFLTADELLREVLADFGVISRDALRTGRTAAASGHDLTRTLHEFLLSLLPIRGCAVLIIDEAQHLSPQVLEQIRILSNLETDDAKLLQIVLVGQPGLSDLLAKEEMRQLNQRISLRATLTPLDRVEVEAYIGHRLDVARAPASLVFEPSAIDRVYDYTAGVPRVINLLCDRALMRAAETQVHTITTIVIDEAARNLRLWPTSMGRPRRRKGDRLPSAAPKWKWRMATILAVLLAALAGGLASYARQAQALDIGAPLLPDAPAYQPMYPSGPKPIPDLDVPQDGPIRGVPRPVEPPAPSVPSYPRFRG